MRKEIEPILSISHAGKQTLAFKSNFISRLKKKDHCQSKAQFMLNDCSI